MPLGVSLTHILVHVEGFHIAKRDLALLMELDQLAVHAQRCAACGQTQNKVTANILNSI